MADEWYGDILQKGDYNFDYNKICDSFLEIINNFKTSDYESIGERLGMNPFDLFMLHTFMSTNNINHVLELGSGTSSKFIDSLKVKRKSFALECIYHDDVNFEKMDLFDSYEIVQSYLVDNDVNLILIDCEHSERMAKLITDKFLKKVEYKFPIFIHDWFDFGKETYTEQIFYYNNLFTNYDLHLMTDLPNKQIKKLTKANSQMNNQFEVPRCSAILTPKEWKM